MGWMPSVPHREEGRSAQLRKGYSFAIDLEPDSALACHRLLRVKMSPLAQRIHACVKMRKDG